MIVSYLGEPHRHPLWNDIQELLNRAGEPDDHELVWIAFEDSTLFGVLTTVLYDDGEANIQRCAGFRHRTWMKEAEAAIVKWARDCGATKITTQGRKGWERYFARVGVSDGKVLYEKAL